MNKRIKQIRRKIQQILYFSVLIFILMFGYRVYSTWYENYKLSHPLIIEAVTTNYNEEQPLEGILLWDEQLIYAPQNGILTYPSPRPRITSKGEMLAALDGRAVYSPYPAYFYPALDGQEGSWVYPKLWPDFAPFPEFSNASLIENGTHLHRGDPIGKLIPQPQVLRCIAYLDRTPSLERVLRTQDNPAIKIRTEEDGKERKADVVAAKVSGQKIKVYLRLPFFPPGVLKSREFKARVVTDVEQGVIVPDTAVITREGKNMVYIVQGNSPILHEIEGFPADDKNFFIAKGVKHGSKLILNADTLNSVNKDSDIERIW